MNGPEFTDRRTVLKTITATLVGGGVVTGTASAGRENSPGVARGHSNVVEIVAAHSHDEGTHEFTLSTDEIPAGWMTFEFDNPTSHTHFAYLAKLPQQAIDEAAEAEVTPLDYYVERVTRPFQWLMDDIARDKEPDPEDRWSDEQLFPAWFGDILPSGGPGLTSPNRTSTTTVNLDPGEYVVECYVKNANNDFHSYHGMLEQLTVTDDRCEAEPESTVDLLLSTEGIDVKGDVRPGQQTVAIRFEDQKLYGHDLGHDIHLIRFDDETTTDDVNGWMNWMNPDGLVSDGTGPGTFLGGVETILTPPLLEAEGSETAYVHVNLKPGDYAWVSEVPDPDANGLLKEFSVPFDCRRTEH